MIGQKLADRYEILSELGRGGMGVVYRAHDPRLNRHVAVKLIPPALLTEEAEQRFQNEAQLVAQMDHPAIVPIHDFGRHEGSLFFVMPVVDGTNLREVAREAGLVLGQVIDIGIQIAEALEYSHGRGVVHRDIKPENVMVTREDGIGPRIRVMDFGLARSTNVTRMTRTGMLVGTVTYISPEQISGRDVDHRSDIYALGTVLYELVTNDVPFTGELQSVLYRIVHEMPRSPRERGAPIDEILDQIILSCLAKDPASRPQKVGEVADGLKRYRAGLRDTERNKSVMLTRTVAVPRPNLAPFVGREEETKELQARLNQAVDGKCQFVVIDGEAGMGKTRLLDELEELAVARQIRVLHGRVVEQEAAFPYYGFCEAVQDYFQQKESGSSSSALPDLSDVAADLISLFPMLSEIESIRTAAGGSSQSAASFEQRTPENRTQIFELLARTMTRLSGGKPLVLLFEDLHGADASIEALQYIVRRLAATQTLVLATYRSPDVDRRHPLTRMLQGFRSDRQFGHITLGPMPAEEHRAFLSTLIGGSEVDESFAERLYEASEGNPFFTKELVRSLLDSGGIAQDNTGAWSLSGGMEISSDALPATIQQAVEERVGRLPEDLREILSVAAVMGRTFAFKDLETLAKGEGDVDEAVDRLVQDGLVEEKRQSRGDRLTFTSGVVREVLYGELSRRRRRSLHRKYASLIEKRHTGRLEGVYPLLVHHFAEGDEPEKTVEYGLLHARKSLEAFSPEEANRSVKTALEYLDKEWEGERTIEGEARMLLAEGHQLAGEINAALREIDSAVKVFERENEPGRSVDAQLFAARAAWQARKTEEARSWLDRGMRAARAADAPEQLREFLSLAATLANLRGEHAKANEYLGEAEQLAPEAETEEQEEIPQGGTLVVPLANPVAATQPCESQFVEEGEVLANVFESLIATDEAGNLVPNLCEQWESEEGGKRFILTLRSDIRFHDGHPLGAEDVKRSFENSLRQGTSVPAAALNAIEGAIACLGGQSDGMAGLVVRGDNVLEITLTEPLPVYPAFLSDHSVGITRSVAADGAGSDAPVGTGPFRAVERHDNRLVLERNPDHWRAAPNLDTLEFRIGLNAAEIAAGLRSGEFDLGRDLLLEDLDELLRDSRFRGRLVEAPRKMIYFILFNTVSGPNVQSATVRKALAGVVRPNDIVWQTLGRFAQPTHGFLPPGILGHDPGKRSRSISREQAAELLRSAKAPESIKLRAAVHPLMQDRYGALLETVFGVWRELGAEVQVATPDMQSFLDAIKDNEGLDMYIGRFGPDYDDPDNFCHSLFRSGVGELAGYFSSEEADRIVDEARIERRPAMRGALYGKFENLLLESNVLAPLFYDLDYRLAGPKVRGLRLGSVHPMVNYDTVGKAEVASATSVVAHDRGGVVRVPMTGRLIDLDPARTHTVEQAEVLPSIFETLTRAVGEARIVPWLAEDFATEDEGKRFRLRLRQDVRFHDGRRVTSRDVRYSFERFLRDESCKERAMYSVVRGARSLIAGESDTLAGFKIDSAGEFSIELERPVAFFPALLSFPIASVVPEGTERIEGNWRSGAVGTGPFRVVAFEPGSRLELERNPSYWRPRYPMSQELVFSFGVSPEQIMEGFRAGSYSLAADLRPQDVETLRREAKFAAGYREVPGLVTYFAAFNIHRGPLSDTDLRRKLARAVDVRRIVGETLGHLAMPAHGLIPPGLLGHESSGGSAEVSSPSIAADGATAETELVAASHPVFAAEFSALATRIASAFREVGVTIRPSTDTVEQLVEAANKGSVDVCVARWLADYPDSDAFVRILHTKEGLYGRMCGLPEIDELIERGPVEPDPDSRHAVYRRIEGIIARKCLMLPLFHEQVYRFAHPDVNGLSVSYQSPTVAYEQLSPSSR